MSIHIFFQVHAKDIDPPSNGGTIKYRIMKAPSERAKFVIDPDTGMIKTIYVSISVPPPNVRRLLSSGLSNKDV